MLEIRIPFDSDRNHLGRAYNEAMTTVSDWVLFIDHDVFLVNPNWHKICLKAIEKFGHTAGWLSCRTNRIACPHQLWYNEAEGDDLKKHLEIAFERAESQKGIYTDVTDLGFLSGFFILTHKEAWQKSGGFVEGFLGVDNNYHISLKNAGYKILVMEELYCYHRYGRYWQEQS